MRRKVPESRLLISPPLFKLPVVWVVVGPDSVVEEVLDSVVEELLATDPPVDPMVEETLLVSVAASPVVLMVPVIASPVVPVVPVVASSVVLIEPVVPAVPVVTSPVAPVVSMAPVEPVVPVVPVVTTPVVPIVPVVASPADPVVEETLPVPVVKEEVVTILVEEVFGSTRALTCCASYDAESEVETESTDEKVPITIQKFKGIAFVPIIVEEFMTPVKTVPTEGIYPDMKDKDNVSVIFARFTTCKVSYCPDNAPEQSMCIVPLVCCKSVKYNDPTVPTPPILQLTRNLWMHYHYLEL